MILNNKKGAASEGLTTLIYLGLFVTFLALASAGIIRGFSSANNVAVNETLLSGYDAGNRTYSNLDNMTSKFVGEDGRARSGILNIADALFTGVGGVITVLFNTPAIMQNVFLTIASSMGIDAVFVQLAFYFLITLAIISAVYMISRR